MYNPTQHNTKEILERAEELVAQGWVHRQEAEDKDGGDVAWDSPDACRWCLSSAMLVASGEHDRESSRVALEELIRKSSTSSYPFDEWYDCYDEELGEGNYENWLQSKVMGWNDVDGRTQDEVVSLVRRAKESLEVT